MLKVLINGLLLNNKYSGIQYYTENLLKSITSVIEKNLRCEVILSKDYNGIIKTSEGLKAVKSQCNSANRINRIGFENFKMAKYFCHNSFNLYHSPGYVLPLLWNYPSVITVHDLIAIEYPELCRTESVFYFKLLLPLSVKKADKIIAVSETTKKDILNQFNIPESKITVINLGVSPIFKQTISVDILLKYQITKKYILFVGNIEPKKNLDRLIRAFYFLKRYKKIDHKLVIVGKKAWKYKSIYQTIDKLKISEEIIFTGYIPEEDLPVIYSMADLFVFPSLYEGFGIPPLEAMACEVPVLVSDKGALPEITGGKCIQVDPYNVEEISKKIYELLTDNELRIKMVEDGKKWVKQYTWEKTATQTVKVYHSVLKKKRI